MGIGELACALHLDIRWQTVLAFFSNSFQAPERRCAARAYHTYAKILHFSSVHLPTFHALYLAQKYYPRWQNFESLCNLHVCSQR